MGAGKVLHRNTPFPSASSSTGELLAIKGLGFEEPRLSTATEGQLDNEACTWQVGGTQRGPMKLSELSGRFF